MAKGGKMPFKKWTSIENHYQNKNIDRFMDHFGGELNKELFVITEKIDGSNFSITFTPDGKFECAKISGPIVEG